MQLRLATDCRGLSEPLSHSISPPATVKSTPRVAGRVTDSDESTEGDAASPINTLLTASPILARFSFFAGIWAIIVDVVNLVIGAYAPGQKVVWAGFLSMGRLADNTFIAHAGQGFSGGDAAFTIIALALLGYGCAAINAQVEGGIAVWLRGFADLERYASLVSTESGAAATVGSWSLLLGIVFYFGWSIVNTTWVDPGVYAVSAPLVGFGIAMQQLAAAQIDEADD